MLTPNALTILEKRYLHKDADGRVIEDPLAMFRRVATATAQSDQLYGATEDEVTESADAFYLIMTDLDFLPNSPTLANAGTELCQSACFVLPVPDDLPGIFEAIKQQGMIHQAGGGTGFSFSRLRPKNDRVGSTKGVASGPVSFARIFNAATEEIKQGGMRRGANMGIMRIDHPDILEFINEKSDLAKMQNFNVSVAITDAFMDALEREDTYALINPRTGEEDGELDAAEVWALIAKRARETGEPGLVFIDRMNRYNPVPWMGDYEATNPCGEQPLLPYESCNLGSINLENFVVDYGHGPVIDWERLRAVIHTATHFLDNVVDANHFPFPKLKEMNDQTRKIGLGVMGFGRMLFKLGVGYDSDEALLLAEQVMSFVDFESKMASVDLAKVRGQYPARAGRERESNTIYRHWCYERNRQERKHVSCDYMYLYDLIEKYGIRNSTTTTVAPTGTIGMIADTSGGCEPAFALAFKRFQADTHMVDSDKVFRSALVAKGFNEQTADLVMRYVEEAHGSLRAMLAGPAHDFFGQQERKKLERLTGVFTTAHDVTPAQHVRVQAAFQRYNDSATSKTINLPESATREDVLDAYWLAWETGCKGITVYVDGSRDAQPLSTSSTKHAPGTAAAQDEPMDAADAAMAFAKTQAEAIIRKATSPRARPEDLYGFTRKVQTGDGSMYLALNYDDLGLREVVCTVGKSGGTLFSLTEAIGRLASLCLQYRVPALEIAKQLIGIRGANTHGFGPNQLLSIPDAVGRAIASAPRHMDLGLPFTEEELPMGGVWPVDADHEVPAALHAVVNLGHSPECAECGARLTFVGGCATCTGCGGSKCG